MTTDYVNDSGMFGVTITASGPARPERYTLHEYNAKTKENSETHYVREDLYEQVKKDRDRYREAWETAQIIVSRGLALMTDEQIGQWTGVRSFVEQEIDAYGPQPDGGEG